MPFYSIFYFHFLCLWSLVLSQLVFLFITLSFLPHVSHLCILEYFKYRVSFSNFQTHTTVEGIVKWNFISFTYQFSIFKNYQPKADLLHPFLLPSLLHTYHPHLFIFEHIFVFMSFHSLVCIFKVQKLLFPFLFFQKKIEKKLEAQQFHI